MSATAGTEDLYSEYVLGPFLLVDKSFIRSLSATEARALHKHFSIVICPVLLEEMISDFDDKKLSEDKQLKQVLETVGKANGISVFTLHDARTMIQADLHMGDVPLGPQIPRFSPREVVGGDGSKGVIIDPTFEDQLLANWSQGNFSELDKSVAGKLKRDLRAYDLPASQQRMRERFPRSEPFQSLEKLAEHADQVTPIWHDQWEFIEIISTFALLDENQRKAVRIRWEGLGKPSLRDFAPYANYCYRVLEIYFIGVTDGLIKTSIKDKTFIDALYFLYLPFVHEFVSADKFHRDHSHLFLRKDQHFTWGNDLKSDLANIASFHKNMSNEERTYFEREFGSYPPPMMDSCSRSIWERHCPPWQPGSGNRAIGRSEEENKKIAEELLKNFGF